MYAYTNADRVQDTNLLIDYFVNTLHVTDEESAVRDLLAHLRHYCDAHRLSFKEELAASKRHYEAEVAEEKNP